MAIEIERKFLLKNDTWKEMAKPVLFRQGYLSTDRSRIVRVRIEGDRGFLTIKGITQGNCRQEYEYEIPIADAGEILSTMCEKPLLEKKRYKVRHKDHVWEIDEFAGENEGLVVAEIELDEKGERIEIPDWIGEEVTGDPRYFNSNLVKNPYTRW